MKEWIYFNKGELPIESSDEDPTLPRRDAYIYNSHTGKWFMWASPSNFFEMPESLVPAEYKAWILVL